MTATVDLKQWPQFRKDSLTLSKNLSNMIRDIDEVISSNISDEEKTLETSRLVEVYLPEGVY
jgi:hypothetical protein